MEAANLRAAREAFRERNPLVRVGYTNDGVSVLKVTVAPQAKKNHPLSFLREEKYGRSVSRSWVMSASRWHIMKDPLSAGFPAPRSFRTATVPRAVFLSSPRMPSSFLTEHALFWRTYLLPDRTSLVLAFATEIGQVLALPRSSQCTTPGQLSIDLHLLRRAEALLVLEAVLRVLARGNALFDRLPHRQDISKHVPGGQRYPPEADQDRVESATAAAIEAGAGHCTRGVESGRNLYAERFTSLEVVVGRGAHSVAGVPRLRPCVAGYLAGKHLRAETVEGDRGKGVVVVRLDSL